ncbi:MAG: hypothetical protein ABNH16_06090 [Thalassolituus sp.]
MNRDEALNRFIKQNIKVLTSEGLSKQSLKKLIRDYFVLTYNNKYGLLKPLQVCEALVKYQIKNGIKKESIKVQIELLPIYKNLGGQNLESIMLLLKDKSADTILSEDELARIDNTYAYTAIKEIEGEKIRLDIEDKNTRLISERKNLEKEIEKRKEELRSIPSILDESDIEEPIFIPEIENVKPWWQRFYLKANPFPGNKDGLSTIDLSLYDKVVVKTRPYQTLIHQVDRNTAEIFNTAYMLVGDFGFGKTTLQDYLIYYLANKNILPVRITCMQAQPDYKGFYDHFSLKLIKELSREINGDSNRFNTSDPDILIDLCTEICLRRDGIIIFLDDYHKHKSEYLSIYDFLGSLQILKDELTRSGCSVGFIVSSVPEWQKATLEHQQMSGFFDSNPIVMPPPTPEFIRDVFNQRIAAYCYDTSPREIKIDFIENIFDRSENKGSYRNYLNRIIEELESNNMAIVSSPIEMSDTEIEQIKQTVKSDASAWSSLQKLLQGSRFKKYNAEQISKCLELLVICQSQNGIDESEPIFSENKYYFSRLNDTALISKRKNPKSPNGFSWVISPALTNCINKIKQDCGYNFQDYFLKIFSHRSASAVGGDTPLADSSVLSKFKAFINENKNYLEEVETDCIETALVLFDKFEVDPTSKKKRDQAVSDMSDAISVLSNALFIIDGSKSFFEDNNISSLEEMWSLHHIDGEDVDQFSLKVRSYEDDDNSTQYSLATRHAKDAFIFISDRIKLILSDIIKSEDDRFGYGPIQAKQNALDISFYDSIRNDIYSPSLEVKLRYIEKFKSHLEKSMKDFLYITSVMIFGENDYFTKAFPNEKIDKFIKRDTNFTLYQSVYLKLDRHEIKTVFMGGSAVKTHIIDNLDVGWDNDTWFGFFDIFVEPTDKTKVDANIYTRFCKLSVEISGAMNSLVSQIPLSDTYIINEPGKGLDSTMFKSGFSLLSSAKNIRNILNSDDPIFPKDQKHERHILDSVMYGRVRKSILSRTRNSFIIENLLDIPYITEHYKVKYYEFLLSLVYLKEHEKSIEISNWFGSNILIKGSKEIISKATGSIDIDIHKFDVALSFPGESRDYVLDVTKELHLELGKDSYFYDNNYTAHLARPDLDTLLQDIYQTRSKLVVVFLSEDYDNKEWCGLEFRAIKQFIKDRQHKRVMLVKLGDGQVKGIFDTDGYLDGTKEPPSQIAKHIIDRLDSL